MLQANEMKKSIVDKQYPSVHVDRDLLYLYTTRFFVSTDCKCGRLKMYNVVPTTVWISKKLVTSRFGISRDANCGLNTFTDNALQIEMKLRQSIFNDIRINSRGI